MLNRIFICIGAQKAGTSWLHHVLFDHPELSFPVVKEVHYFDHVHLGSAALHRRRESLGKELERRCGDEVAQHLAGREAPLDRNLLKELHFAFDDINDRWYENLFDRELVAVDITPAYSVLTEVGFSHIRNIADNLKILFILRNPVDRTLSQIRYKHSNDLRSYQGKLSADIQSISDRELIRMVRSPGVFSRSNYPQTIRRMFSVFQRRQFQIMYYDDLCNDPELFLKKICSFLNIRYREVPVSKLAFRVNQGKPYVFSDKVDREVRKQCFPVIRELQALLPDLPRNWLPA